MKRILFVVVFVLTMAAANAGEKCYEANWASLDARPVPQWYEDAKFGIFIHWGVYSVPSWAPNAGDVYTQYAEWYWNRIAEKAREGEEFRHFHDSIYHDAKYQDFASQFKAELFNPTQWASLFERAGAKYVVLTSKHHEGFALWPSAESCNWNSVDIGPHRDICGDLTKAVKAKGLHGCLR